jgi:AbrB family looped-hinge helix DNA binding protein
MKRMKASVTERGQTMIPKWLQDRLRIKPGTVLEFSEEHGKLIAVNPAASIRWARCSDASARDSTLTP